MPATIKKMGKVAASPFGALTKAGPAKKSNKLVLVLIVVGGVGIIWYLRTHSSANTVGKSTTDAAVSINGGSAPDQSTIDNLTASVLALQGQVTNNPSVPGGGTSTPITTTPSNTNPGSGSGGNTNYVQGAWSGAANFVQGTGYANVTGTAGGTSVTQGNPAINNAYPTVVFGNTPYTNDAAGTAGWLKTLISTGPTNYQGPASGNNAGNEWQRNTTQAIATYLQQSGKAINSVGAYGPGYNADASPMTDAQLTAQAKAVLGGK
jgi:hypothetical protein